MRKIKKIKIVSFFLISIMILMDLGSEGILPPSQEGFFGEQKSILYADIQSSSPLKNFNYYKHITFNSSKISGLVNHTNFPAYVSIYDSDLKDKVKPDGSDLSFYSDLEKLDHEIEVFNQSYNSTHAHLAAWVRIPSLSPNADTNITMYYGNLDISSQENPSGVWDANYKGVWHLNEDPGPGLSGDIKDSTINKKNGTAEPSMESNDSVPGQFYNSINFDGIDDYISIGNLSEEVHTISFWMNCNNFNGSSQSTDWYSPGTVTNVARTGSISPWLNPDQAIQQNDSYSVADVEKGGYSDWLRFTNFSLNIPESATINGIMIEIDRYAEKSYISDESIRLVKNGIIIGVDKNSSEIWPVIDNNVYVGYGAENDTWNSSLTPIDINNSTWGFQISAQNTRLVGTLVFSSIDHARVKVFYSENMPIIGINNISHIEIDQVSNEIKTYNMGGASSIYINGTLDSFISLGWNYIAITNTDGINSSSVNFGKDSVGCFNGSLDEIRFSTNIESVDLITTQYEN